MNCVDTVAFAVICLGQIGSRFDEEARGSVRAPAQPVGILLQLQVAASKIDDHTSIAALERC